MRRVSPTEGQILFDCLGMILGEQRGSERHFTNLIEEIAKSSSRDFVFLVNQSSKEFFERLFPATRIIVYPTTGNNRILRMALQMAALPLVTRLQPCRLYVSTSVFPAIGSGCRTGVFVHDLLVHHFPETFGKWGAAFRKAILSASLGRFDMIFTLSANSVQDIQRWYGSRLKGGVHVVPCGVAPDKFPEAGASDDVILEKLGLGKSDFVLSVLGGNEYKNQRGLAAAASVIAAERPLKVVVAGDAWAVFRRFSYPGNLLPVGVVDDATLGVLYRKAKAFVFPTLFEGFGIPVIEAQAYGLPVVCSDIPVLREVGGDGALYVDPRTPAAIAAAIRNVVEDSALRDRLVSAGRKNAAQFTWARSMRELFRFCEAPAAE